MVKRQERNVFGIDLGTTYSCIAYVDEHGQPVVVANVDNDHTTPSVVLFDGENRIVGKEAKNNAVLSPDQVVEMVKRHMGEAHWSFEYNGVEYTAEEISSYILRKLADDTEKKLGIPVKDVVITCPAYFGVAEREATALAGEIAHLNVLEVINEPTAAAIMYGVQNEQDQTVLVYDLGGGTFDITVITIQADAITVVATGGDHTLGGRNWDEAVIIYLAEQWKEQIGSSEDPLASEETRQDLWMQAERAKLSLTVRESVNAPVIHNGQRIKVELTRKKFDELTAHWLERTIMFTTSTMQEARARGVQHFDRILLVGGSTKMPQVAKRLQQEFHLPCLAVEQDEAVAKGAAIYAHKLLLDEKIQIKIVEIAGNSFAQSTVPDAVLQRAQQEVAIDNDMQVSMVRKYNEMEVTNVASHSFGIVVVIDSDTPRERDAISNLVYLNEPLPIAKTKTFYTRKTNQRGVEITVMENTMQEELLENLKLGEEIGKTILQLPAGLPIDAPIEVTFELDRQGRLHVVAREPVSNAMVDATIETKRGISSKELRLAKGRASQLAIS